MSSTFASRALCSRERVLADGRRVTLRHVVPTDEPRLELAFGPTRDAISGVDLIAFDDRGEVVGHVCSSGDVVVVAEWRDCGLDALLARELEEA
jgi:hypothetical protein